MSKQNGGMQSVRRALQVLEAVADIQPVGVGTLSRELQMPKSTVQRCLVTLGQAGWLRQAGRSAGLWSLAPHAWAIGRKAAVDLIAAAEEPLQQLREIMNETVYLLVQRGSDAIITERLESTRMVRVSRPLGDHTHLYATAGGRAMLAMMPDEEVDELVPTTLEAFADGSVLSRQEFKEILVHIRQTGYAISNRLNEPDVCSIGAAIVGDDGAPIACISVSMPDGRFNQTVVDQHAADVVAAAQQTAINMGLLAKAPQR